MVFWLYDDFKRVFKSFLCDEQDVFPVLQGGGEKIGVAAVFQFEFLAQRLGGSGEIAQCQVCPFGCLSQSAQGGFVKSRHLSNAEAAPGEGGERLHTYI